MVKTFRSLFVNEEDSFRDLLKIRFFVHDLLMMRLFSCFAHDEGCRSRVAHA